MRTLSSGRPRARRGMALPMVIVVLLVLTASFAGGVAMARGERALDDADKAGVLAQSYAETGLQRVIADRASLGLTGQPGASDSTRVTFSGGYYDVITTRLRSSTPALYYMRSHAVVTRTGVAGGPSAEYTVTQLATWSSGTMTVQSALTGVNGTNKAGNAGQISGVDQCPVSSGGSGTTIAAVAGPTTASDGGPGYDGMTGPLVGTPLVQSLGATPTAAAAAVPINWPGIYNMTAITPDFVVDSAGRTIVRDSTGAWTLQTNTALQLNWSTYWTTNPNSFPVIFVKNGPPNGGFEYILGGFGKGLLIVQDDIRLNGNTAGWDGIIITGGRVRSNGSNRVQGATVTGLNTQMGYTPDANDVNDLNGTKQFLYDSCNVKSATSAMGSLRIYPATWTNNFKTY